MRSKHASFLTVICLVLCSTAMSTVSAYSSSSPSSLISAESFATVKDRPAQRLTLFYFSTDRDSEKQVTLLERTAQRLHSLTSSIPALAALQYVHVDCDLPINAPECRDASFRPGQSWMFTSLPQEGIQQYNGPRTLSALITHIRHKFLPTHADLVRHLMNESSLWHQLDDSPIQPPRPIFVKFFEHWCAHCQQLARPFTQAAGFFNGQIEFREVECSKNKQTQTFCQHQAISSYPTLILFDGEQKVRYERLDKTIREYHAFFRQHLSPQQYSIIDISEEDGAAVYDEEASRRRSRSRKKQKKDTQADDEDEEREDSDSGEGDGEQGRSQRTSQRRRKSKGSQSRKRRMKRKARSRRRANEAHLHDEL